MFDDSIHVAVGTNCNWTYQPNTLCIGLTVCFAKQRGFKFEAEVVSVSQTQVGKVNLKTKGLKAP